MKVIDHGHSGVEQFLISRAILDAITAHCMADKSIESCGLVGGRGELALSFYPTHNIAADPSHNFLIDPKDQLDAFKTMRSKSEELLAIVHSHPNSPATPSPTDLKTAAYPGTVYLIVSLMETEVSFGSFVFETTGFREVTMDIL
ncbi:MAG: M67 family metallopeptidase [Pseudomonadota bacterium]